ncbi:hypothetical protein [Paraeggerthella sp.]|uniref:hypothetical protein n=1 Tax=Paraeggerthella sp. TaxID=2897350 RepID=UPI003528D1F4
MPVPCFCTTRRARFEHAREQPLAQFVGPRGRVAIEVRFLRVQKNLPRNEARDEQRYPENLVGHRSALPQIHDRGSKGPSLPHHGERARTGKCDQYDKRRAHAL